MRYAVRASLAIALGATFAIGGCSESSTVDDEDGGGIMFDASPPVDSGDTDGGVDGSTASPGDIGGACSSAEDCGEGAVCIGERDGFTGGYCTSDCTGGGECPEGSTCTPIDREGNALCLDNCDPAAETRECRMGYGCAESFMLPSPVCLPGCTDDSDCDEGLECDPMGGTAGQCFDPGANVGDACTETSNCPADTFCLSEDFTGWPGGACIGFRCDVEADSGCPDGSHCVPSGRGGGICLAGCDTGDDCRDGYDCDAGGEDYPDRLVCIPGCTDDDQCSGGRVCNPGTGQCDVPFDPSEYGTTCSTTEGACAGGSCLSEFESGFPGSYCAYVGCDPTMADDSDGCPGDGVCIEGGGGQGVCLDGCEGTPDCRAPDYECRAVDPDDASRGMGCFPACESDDACANDGFVCNDGTGLCTEAFDAADLGEPCVDGEDCPGGACISEAGDGWPAGTCVAVGCRLTGDGPSEPCPEGGVCIDDESGDPDLGVCALSCELGTSGTCRPGYACTDIGDGTGACQPACEEGDCGSSRTCDTETGLCG